MHSSLSDSTGGVRAGDEHDFEVPFTISQEGPFTVGNAHEDYVSTETFGAGVIRCDKLPFPGLVRPCILTSFGLSQKDLFDTDDGPVEEFAQFTATDKTLLIKLGDDNVVKKMPILLLSSEFCTKAKLTLLDSGRSTA